LIGIGAFYKSEVKAEDSEAFKGNEEKARLLFDYLNRYIAIEESRMHLLHSKSNYRLVNFTAPSEYATTLYSRSVSEGNSVYYKMTRNDPYIVHFVLEANGLQPSDKNWTLLWSNNPLKPYLYKDLNEYQRVNHFPGSSEITRKDRLCENIVQRQQKYGKALFNVIPDTYVLPDEFPDFFEHFQELKKASKPNMWIIKPNSLSRGRGIRLISDPSDVPIEESCVISRYVDNPLLINEHKFDIRLYVVLTSIDPLLIYIYNEGLTRFCSEKYDIASKDNRFSHLTNYSINKKNKKFVANKSVGIDNIGQKWSVTALNKHLQSNGVDVVQLWARIYDLIIRTFIACEPSMYASHKKLTEHRRNCFELFGFDILIDENLKPWVMEVNLSPSLACETPLDFQIKSNLIADMFTLIGIRQVNKRNGHKGRCKKNIFDDEFKSSVTYKKIVQLNRKHRDILIDCLEEFDRRRNFIRIYPAKGTDTYDNLFEVTREHHKALYKLLYSNELLNNDNAQIEVLPSISVNQRNNNKKVNLHKVVITGDDILIEYVKRLVLVLKKIKEPLLKLVWLRPIERFINHKVWSSKLNLALRPKLWQQLEGRLLDMKERRNLLKKEEVQDSQQKQTIIKEFSVNQLEEMLKSSAKNSSCQIVSCLLPSLGPGTLSNITTWLSKHNSSLTDNETQDRAEDDCETLSNISKISFPKITPEHKSPYLTPIKVASNKEGRTLLNSESKLGYYGNKKRRVYKSCKPLDMRTSSLITQGESVEEGLSLNNSNYKMY